MRTAAMVVVLSCCSAIFAEPPAPGADGFVTLFNGKDLAGWVPVQVAPSTFTVKEGMIHCTGKPTGVMRTEKQYENFILELEWRHTVPRGNAGVFVWSDPVTARGQPFTRGVEVQVLDGPNGDWYTTHGDVFPIHGATMKPDNPGKAGMRAYPTEHRSKPSPEWNHYRIECVDGNISLAVNGKVVTTGREASPRKGYICLESEGGVVDWRNLRIKELPPSKIPLASKDVADVDTGFKSLYTGVDMTGWNTADGVGDHWKVSDWTFFYDGKGEVKHETLWTDQDFGDYELILDYRLEPDGGPLVIYPHGETGPKIELSADTPGSQNPKEWNRLTAKIEKGKLSAAINGRELLKNAPVNTPRGPLGLRAARLTSFANAYVRPLKD